MSTDHVSISLAPLAPQKNADNSEGGAARKLHLQGGGESAPLTSQK